MLVRGTAEDSANPVGEFVGAQQPVGLYNLALAVDQFGFDRVELRALPGQKATYDPRSSFAATLFDLAVVEAEPAPDLFGENTISACCLLPCWRAHSVTCAIPCPANFSPSSLLS